MIVDRTEQDGTKGEEWDVVERNLTKDPLPSARLGSRSPTSQPLHDDGKADPGLRRAERPGEVGPRKALSIR